MPTTLMLSLLLAGAAPPLCTTVHTPFEEAARTAAKTFEKRVKSRFGDGRKSYQRGHKHAGVDLRTTYGEAVLAMCEGEVVDIHLGSPHRTVVVRHIDADGTVWFSSYKHIEDIEVTVGEEVDARTKIGRVFSKAEQRDAPWSLNHLHLEIRHSIEDGGDASWTCMSMAQLKRYAHDPERFVRRRMKAQKGR